MILHLWHQNISCLATINSAKTVFWYQNLNPAKRCCCGVFRLGSSKSVPSLYPAWNSTAFFGVFFFAFYVLKFASLYYFRVFSRLFFNSAKSADSAVRNGRNTLFTPPCLRRHWCHCLQDRKKFQLFFFRYSCRLKRTPLVLQADNGISPSAVSVSVVWY